MNNLIEKFSSNCNEDSSEPCCDTIQCCQEGQCVTLKELLNIQKNKIIERKIIDCIEDIEKCIEIKDIYINCKTVSSDECKLIDENSYNLSS